MADSFKHLDELEKLAADWAPGDIIDRADFYAEVALHFEAISVTHSEAADAWIDRHVDGGLITVPHMPGD